MRREPYYFISRIKGRDLFLTRHAMLNTKKYRISLKDIIKNIVSPKEKYLDTTPAKYRGFKRYCYVRKINEKYLLVITEEDDKIIVITSFRIGSRKKYERHRENKIRRREWIPL